MNNPDRAIDNPTISRQKTALKRHNFSRPINTALNDGLLDFSKVLFDYGCGRGDDIKLLNKSGVQSSGWDPEFKPSAPMRPADVVNLGYVINVIEDPKEREATLKKAWELAKDLLIVSAQLKIDAKAGNYSPYKDGYLTKRGTFQKYFDQHELRQWIVQALVAEAIPAAPGIFYIFRDNEAKEAFISSRYRRRTAVPRQRKADQLFEEHNDILQPLMAFFTDRGRIPDATEIAGANALREVFGSIKKAFRVVRLVTEAEQWDRIRDERSQDLLIYLALSRFDGRPKFSKLPRQLQLDVKAFFSTYKRACQLSDVLLFSCGNQELVDQSCAESSVGKITPNALYVHASALDELSPLLRTYEGCARSYIGMIEGANIVKLHRRKSIISYLSYPAFEKDPHPALKGSFSVNLQTFRIRQISYLEPLNPPILHRKELFVSENYGQRAKFKRLTKSEEKAGLYNDTKRIGRRNEWRELLGLKGVYLKGHRLLKRKTQHESH